MKATIKFKREYPGCQSMHADGRKMGMLYQSMTRKYWWFNEDTDLGVDLTNVFADRLRYLKDDLIRLTNAHEGETVWDAAPNQQEE